MKTYGLSDGSDRGCSAWAWCTVRGRPTARGQRRLRRRRSSPITPGPLDNEPGANNALRPTPTILRGRPADGGQPSAELAARRSTGRASSSGSLSARPCNCCGPVGKYGPIGSGALRPHRRQLPDRRRTGGRQRPSGLHGRRAGLRTLYFNQPDAAWVIDLGLSTQWHDIMHSPPAVLHNVDVLQTQQGSTQQTKVNVPSVTVIASSVHYLLGNVTLGRELYLWALRTAPASRAAASAGTPAGCTARRS